MIEKRVILSYQRTGSTPVLDVYRKFQESYYPSSIRVPAEVSCRDTWVLNRDFDLIDNPYQKFKEKYGVADLMRYMSHLPHEKYMQERQRIGETLFDNILKEDVYTTKMFPEQFNNNFMSASDKLKKVVNDEGKIIALYRRGFLDSLASLLLAFEEDRWVLNENWKRVVNRLYLKESTKLPKHVIETEVLSYVKAIQEWHKFLKHLKKLDIPFTVVAYEDIPYFDYRMLNTLEDTKFLSGYKSCLLTQSDSRDRVNALYREKDIVDKAVALAQEVLPINNLFQLDIKL
jgi:hypothetical protein